MKRIRLVERVREAEAEGRGPQVRCAGCRAGPMPRSTWSKNHAPHCQATIQAREQMMQAQLQVLQPGPAQQQAEHGGEGAAWHGGDEEMGQVGDAGEQFSAEGGPDPYAQPLHDGAGDGWAGDLEIGHQGEQLQGSQFSGQGQEETAGQAEEQQQLGAGGEQGAEGPPEHAAEDAQAGATAQQGGLEIETETEPSDGDSEEMGALDDAQQEAGDGGGGRDGNGQDGDEEYGDTEDEEEQGSGAGSEPEDEIYQTDRYRKGSAAWRWDQRGQPLWRSHAGACPLTSLQATFLLMDWRRRHKLKTAAVDELFRALADLLLPPDNLFPPSLYHARKLVGAQELEAMEWHLCDNGCTAFPPVKRAAWRQRAEEACKRCGGKRFKPAGHQDAGASGARIKPVRVMYYFGVAPMLQSLHMDPEFSAARREGCQGGPSTLRGYPEYTRLNGRVGGILDDPSHSLVEIAADGFQPFSNSQHSSHLVAIRSGDLLPHVRGKERFTRVLALVAGGSAPPCPDGMLQPILDEFCKHGPEGKDLVVVERCRTPAGEVTVSKLRQRIVLSAVYADMPERQYLARWPGAKAQLPCGYCRIQGTLRGRQYVPQGYLSPVLHNITFQPSRSLYANADELWVTDKMHKGRGKLVDAGRDASLLGCRGSCRIAAQLPYVSLATLFPLPVAHQLLLGLQKGFWVLALTTVGKGQARPPYVLPNGAKRELAARCNQLRVPSDFGRTLKDIVKYHRVFTMEEWAQVADCFGQYLARDGLLGPVLGRIWGLLSAVTTFVLRAAPGNLDHPYTDATLDAFEKKMWKLAVHIERDLPPNMCTLNLHQAQHIARQARLLGPPSARTEVWMERAIKVAKRPSKHSVSRAPEAMVARMLLDNLAVEALAREPSMLSFDQWLPAYSAAELQGPDHDRRDEESGCLLLFKGHALKQREHAADVQLVQHLIAAEAPPGWHGAQVSGGQLRKFTAAQLGSGNVVHSAAHRASSRASCYAPISLQLRSGRQAVHVARVLYFLRAKRPDAPDTLRLAVCQVYAEQPQRQGMYVARPAEVWRERWPVRLDVLGAPLVTALPPGSGQLFGMKYFSLSKLA